MLPVDDARVLRALEWNTSIVLANVRRLRYARGMTSAHSAVRTDSLLLPQGHQIVHQTLGNGPPIVLCNGLGGTFDAWRHLTTMLAPRYRVFSWYYRGLHGSSVPDDRTRVRVEDQVDDLEALMDHWKVPRAVFVGWSMGVQVSFEMVRRAPQRVAAIAALNGVPGRALDTVAGVGPLGRYVLPSVLKVARTRASGVNTAARAVTRWRGFIGLGKRVGLFGKTLDDALFAELLDAYGQLEFGLYSDTLRALGEHDAWSVLPGITVPTAIISGTRDFMTPVHVARRMAQQIPGATLHVIDEGTHFAAVERPELVNEAVTALLKRADY